MKIIDAFWEKRNLGVTCYEISVERNETVSEIAETYEALEEREYMVVRIPSGNYDALRYFQEKRYMFIESALTLEHSQKEIRIPKKAERIISKCSWSEMNNDDIEILKNEIDLNIFKTDRVFLDPFFSKEQAARRYKCWTEDLINAGNRPIKIVYDNKTVGFGLYEIAESGVCTGVLGGVYKAYENSGIGVCVICETDLSMKARGAKRIIARVSGNNPDIIKIHIALGFHLLQTEYIFIKHNT